THGFFSLPTGKLAADDPLLRCGLAFAGFNYLPDGKGKQESLPGLLTGAEVLAANLHGTELVVLSPCETGPGQTRPGQSPADLRQAFHLAGARTVVSTLWSVPDQPSARLMVQFIRRLAKKGATGAAALRAAKLKLIEGYRDDYAAAHPFYWAA